MDRLVRHWRSANQVVEIKKHIASVFYILYRDGVDVMNLNRTKNISSLDSEITTIIAPDYFVAHTFPFRRPVKRLVNKSLKSKRLLSNFCRQSKVFVPLLEIFDLRKRGIASNNPRTHLHRNLDARCKWQTRVLLLRSAHHYPLRLPEPPSLPGASHSRAGVFPLPVAPL